LLLEQCSHLLVLHSTRLLQCLDASLEIAHLCFLCKNKWVTTGRNLKLPCNCNIGAMDVRLTGRMDAMDARMQNIESRMHEMDVRLTGRMDDVMLRLGKVELRYAMYGF